MTTTTAAAVSAALRRQGIRPIPSDSPRRGVKVVGKGLVFVRIDIDGESAEKRVRDSVARALHVAGYAFQDSGTGSICVEGKA